MDMQTHAQSCRYVSVCVHVAYWGAATSSTPRSNTCALVYLSTLMLCGKWLLLAAHYPCGITQLCQMSTQPPDCCWSHPFPCRWDSLKEAVKIAMIGKYTALSDAYLSVIKALQHACMAAGLKLQLDWVEAQYLEPHAQEDNPAKYELSWKQVCAPVEGTCQ